MGAWPRVVLSFLPYSSQWRRRPVSGLHPSPVKADKKVKALFAPASAGVPPLEPIRIKLSIDSFRTRDGFVLLTYVLVQDLHGCPSFSRSLGRQTCGGGTHMDEEAAQGEFGLKESLPPTRCEGLAMPHQFQQTPFTLSLRPEVCPSLGAECRLEHNEQHA